MTSARVICGDAVAVLPTLEPESVVRGGGVE